MSNGRFWQHIYLIADNLSQVELRVCDGPEGVAQDGADETLAGGNEPVGPEGLDGQQVVDRFQLVVKLLSVREVHDGVFRVGVSHPVPKLWRVQTVHDGLEGLGELVLQLLGARGRHLYSLEAGGPDLDLFLASQHVLEAGFQGLVDLGPLASQEYPVAGARSKFKKVSVDIIHIVVSLYTPA